MIFRITVLIIFVFTDVSTCSGTDPMQSGDDEEGFKWSPELDAIITDIYYKTMSKGRSHMRSVKEEWDRLLPQYRDVNALKLRRRAQNLIHKQGETKVGRVNWTPRLESNLVEMYAEIARSGIKGPSFKLHEEFYRKHPNIARLTPQSLWEKAKISYEKLRPDGKGKLKLKIPWKTTSFEDDALRVYREQPPNHKNQAQRLYEEWVKLHPEHEIKTPRSLQSRMRKMARERTGEGGISFIKRHKWTKEEHADLLHIHRRLKANDVNHLSELHERWEKMNPKLKHMDKSRLREKLKYLLNKRYEPTASEDEESRVKFDRLPLPEASGGHKKRRYRKDKGKAKLDSAAKNQVAMSSQLQDLRSLQFYDFMSVSGSHGRSLYKFDVNGESRHMASSNQVPYIPMHNYHHGESSNLSQQQQIDPDLRFPSKNLPNFLFNSL